ncbi:TetR/AcrR family transcriptional regulator [Solitalea canadensis]|uniref:Transcriptional regulator n=1 Tax=Solitalea canadensis (strain ATCC 29591 / DSM 3403 / JCM 21819 / LMG 8368 / NBRC 15130 / NCIMB 12057 / USAM 9D) TaxID=929556 RepID=H8KTP1_SOLCM|nr:TetR/AcrR family transcriptional regulator [Solitalea canadensis]AFD06616.1 transcriptional regulator [Solitalea canadensis DSM 3403]
MNTFTERQVEIMEAASVRIDKFGIQSLTIKNLASDIGLSEPALYRHFNSKNDILLGLLTYFIAEMKTRIALVIAKPHQTAGEELRAIFDSQLNTLIKKPAIVSVIFSESIFHFDDDLSKKVAEIMELMQGHINRNIESGQKASSYSKLINASTLTTIILGSIRLTVLKWKQSGHKSDLVKEGTEVLAAILKMIENNK